MGINRSIIARPGKTLMVMKTQIRDRSENMGKKIRYLQPKMAYNTQMLPIIWAGIKITCDTDELSISNSCWLNGKRGNGTYEATWKTARSAKNSDRQWPNYWPSQLSCCSSFPLPPHRGHALKDWSELLASLEFEVRDRRPTVLRCFDLQRAPWNLCSYISGWQWILQAGLWIRKRPRTRAWWLRFLLQSRGNWEVKTVSRLC